MYFIGLTSTIKCNQEWDEAWTERQIQTMAQGDKAALEQLYQRTKAPIYAYLLSVLKNSHDAEDALQETYLGIHASAPSYRPNGQSKAWIYTIAKNQAMMIFRRKRSAESLEDQDEGSLEAPSGPSTEDKMILSAAMDTLTEEERQIVMLHAVSGFRFREIASFLNLPLSTVLSKHHRALKRLKQKLMSEEEHV